MIEEVMLAMVWLTLLILNVLSRHMSRLQCIILGFISGVCSYFMRNIPPAPFPALLLLLIAITSILRGMRT